MEKANTWATQADGGNQATLHSLDQCKARLRALKEQLAGDPTNGTLLAQKQVTY